MIFSTNDIKELRLKSINESDEDDLNETENLNIIDEIISFYCSSLLNIFPSITIKYNLLNQLYKSLSF